MAVVVGATRGSVNGGAKVGQRGGVKTGQCWWCAEMPRAPIGGPWHMALLGWQLCADFVGVGIDVTLFAGALRELSARYKKG